MPTIDGIGQSDFTMIKHRHVNEFIEMWVALASKILARNSWMRQHVFFLDCTAGCGAYKGIETAPLTFLRACKASNVAGNAVLYEQNEETAGELMERVKEFDGEEPPWVDVGGIHGHALCTLACRYQDAIIHELDLIDDKTLALIYYDPNGGKDYITDLPEFGEWFRRYSLKRTDFLFNVSATSLRRTYHLHDGRLDELLATIQKKKLFIAEPRSAWRWHLIFGSNWPDFPQLNSVGFHDMSDAEGQYILYYSSEGAAKACSREEWMRSFRNVPGVPEAPTLPLGKVRRHET